jgi:predicted sugar kinase
MVDHLRQGGVGGVAQSSWGPTIAAVVEDDDRAKAVTADLRQHFGMAELEMIVTSARNEKARLSHT